MNRFFHAIKTLFRDTPLYLPPYINLYNFAPQLGQTPETAFLLRSVTIFGFFIVTVSRHVIQYAFVIPTSYNLHTHTIRKLMCECLTKVCTGKC